MNGSLLWQSGSLIGRFRNQGWSSQLARVGLGLSDPNLFLYLISEVRGLHCMECLTVRGTCWRYLLEVLFLEVGLEVGKATLHGASDLLEVLVGGTFWR